MKIPWSQLIRRIVPIAILMLMVGSYFLIKTPDTPGNNNGPSIIIDDETPLASLSNAQFFITQTALSADNLTSLTEDMFAYVGEGTVFYGKDVYDNSAAVQEALATVPDLSSFVADAQAVDWRYILKIDQEIYVLGISSETILAPVNAEFYLFNPNGYEAAFTNVTPDMADFIGSGQYFYTEDLYNQTESVWSQIANEPEYTAPDGEYIEWGSAYRFQGNYIVMGKYAQGEKPVLPNLRQKGNFPADMSSLDPNAFDHDSAGQIFSDIASLKAADLEVDTIAQTEGYSYSGDNGAAEYVIKAAPDFKADNIFVVPMDNGKYAHLVYDSESMINVACAGIQPDNQISSNLNTLITSSDGRVKGIQFNDGTYILNAQIKLKSLKYAGTGNTQLTVSNEFTSDRVLCTIPDSSHPIYSLSFDNIDFIFETSSTHGLKGKEAKLLSLHEIDGCDITNCNFYAYPADTDGAFMKVDLLWFKHSVEIKNINIEHCSFHNLTGRDIPSGTLVGGCLWICGASNDYATWRGNINISDCEFENTVSDESIAIWRGDFHNIKIHGCTFTNHSHASSNVIALYGGAFNDVALSDCTFNLNVSCVYVIKVTQLVGESNIDFSNITFNLTSGVSETVNKNIALFYTGSDYTESNDIPFNANLNGITVNATSDTAYRVAVVVSKTSNKNYTITDSDINVRLSQGMRFLNNAPNNTVTY